MNVIKNRQILIYCDTETIIKYRINRWWEKQHEREMRLGSWELSEGQAI